MTLAAAGQLWLRHAFVFGSCVTGMKTCIADYLVQTSYEGREVIDWRRNFVFSSFGLCYLGAFQYVQYTLWFPRIFPGSGAVAVAKRVAFDQLINTGLWYYPLFYAVSPRSSPASSLPHDLALPASQRRDAKRSLLPSHRALSYIVTGAVLCDARPI